MKGVPLTPLEPGSRCFMTATRAPCLICVSHPGHCVHCAVLVLRSTNGFAASQFPVVISVEISPVNFPPICLKTPQLPLLAATSVLSLLAPAPSIPVPSQSSQTHYPTLKPAPSPFQYPHTMSCLHTFTLRVKKHV